MKAELVAVGSELLRFGRRDSNGDWLTERLQRLGVEVTRRSLVGDDVASIASAVRAGQSSADLVVLTGGLGPTEDDRTREAIALALGRPLERDEEYATRLRGLFEARGRTFKPEQARQADRPRGSDWLDNPIGTAPGILCRVDESLVVALPGVPPEMRRIFEEGLVPHLSGRVGQGLARRSLKIGGRFEASVDEQIRDLYGLDGIEATILTGREGIELHLLATGGTTAEARARLDDLELRLEARLGADIFARDDETLAQVVGRLLIAKGATMATAESCTGGMLGSLITEAPGSSGWFRGGLIVYSDDLKCSLAGAAPDVVASAGAVSEVVARALAAGARERCRADYGIGITGIAGPGGGTPDKPVGLVHVALAGKNRTDHWRIRQIGDRHLVRRRTVVFALDRLRRRLLESREPEGIV
jgi:nicotinamide-nucleotide amidase